MYVVKQHLKTFFTRAKIEFLVAAISVSLLAVHGYADYGDALDNEKLELETTLSNAATNTIKTSTTTIPILVYHKINKPDLALSPTQTSKKFCVQSDVFESQMKMILQQGYTPLTIQELIKEEQNSTLPTKPIAITFDDGWRSQYEMALPVLLKYRIPATFYIYTGVIGSPAYMTFDHLKELVQDGMEIGDHTKSHVRLTKIDPSRFNEELVGSKHVLEKNLKISISDFAYPYGSYNGTVIDAVRNAGYISARTSKKGIYNDFKDLYQLNVLYAPSDVQTLQEMLNK